MELITLVVGLPGSGKSTWAYNVKDISTVVIDDPKTFEEIDSEFRHIKKFCPSTKKVIITDPWLCLKDNQSTASQKLSGYANKINWVFFENNPEQCLINSQRRIKEVENDIRFFSRNYYIPTNCIPISVYKPEYD